ncbi:ABC transporter ATP-binding protein [Paenibacillus radicis (ex Gao et al. 2016)]|uniref:Carnitine transport ATP-binding protein OpuCA n=1 Tax=Paenibacillus radicis (ex Gao et al. 2016) TaxID=1737354 RepID=A0A917H2Z4_9BACL|nr:ABC transporter ATP-binding protein [Paenibacillus radicis (ex Gao et al. 2016)]GGG65349.1 glycine/betaine ABC transporter ATP-binding protein [Paenibacillus radicis (ex Gao et al. 2016)]
MNQDAIVFNRVTKTFPKAAKPAVNETNLRIEAGSFVTILGASGCGKTTLLKMINRIHEPSSGNILINGQEITKMPLNALRIQIGYVIQGIGLFPHLSIEENIATIPKVLKWSPKRIEERIDYLLDLVHLPQSFKKRYPAQLSGGQQQRVGLARAMAGDPAIMLMDEPFGAIDAITRESLQDEMIQIQKKLNKTILFVTHDVQEAMKLGDRIIVMNEGTIQQYDTPLEILARPANEFVQKLVKSDNQFNQLDLIKAEDAMVPIDSAPNASSWGEARVTGRESSLKSVLLLLLQPEVSVVWVVDEQDIPVGSITWEQLKLKV